MSELTFLSAVDMAEQIREKKISPVELVEAHLAKIEQTESEVERLRARRCRTSPPRSSRR